MIYVNVDELGYVISYTDTPVVGHIPIDCPNFSTRPDVRLRVVGGKIVEEPISVSFSVQRAKKYPPIGDQLDALWKLIQANSDKIDLGEAAPLLAAVQEVKDKYPKAP
jgi:hypothetical protein